MHETTNHSFNGLTGPEKNIPKGVILSLLAYFFITLNDAISKQLIDLISLSQLLFVRTFFCLVLLCLYLPFSGGWAVLKPKNSYGVLLCGVLLVPNLFLFPFSLSYLPLTTALVLVYISPVFVVLGAPLFGDDRPGPRRIAAAALGFLGVVVVVNPGVSGLQTAMFIPVLCAFILAVRDMLTRKIALSDHPMTITIISFVLTLCTSVMLGFFQEWRMLELREIALLASPGALITLGQLMAVFAFKFAFAPIVSTLKYTSVIWSALLGYTVWDTIPRVSTFVGAVFIIISGVAMVMLRDRRLASLATPVLSRKSEYLSDELTD